MVFLVGKTTTKTKQLLLWNGIMAFQFIWMGKEDLRKANFFSNHYNFGSLYLKYTRWLNRVLTDGQHVTINYIREANFMSQRQNRRRHSHTNVTAHSRNVNAFARIDVKRFPSSILVLTLPRQYATTLPCSWLLSWSVITLTSRVLVFAFDWLFRAGLRLRAAGPPSLIGLAREDGLTDREEDSFVFFFCFTHVRT